jgi:hypothetical protein
MNRFARVIGGIGCVFAKRLDVLWVDVDIELFLEFAS